MFKRINQEFYNFNYVRKFKFGFENKHWIKLYFRDWSDKKIYIKEEIDIKKFITYITDEK